MIKLERLVLMHSDFQSLPVDAPKNVGQAVINLITVDILRQE